MRIGSLTLANPMIFAPLAGISNLPLRLLVKAAGCGLVTSEMVSSNGLVHGSRRTRQLLESAAAEKPLAVQIFGADPEIMAEAARQVAEAGADVIDINFGCAVPKVIKTGAGVALMRTPETAESLLRAVRRAVPERPLTIKIRSGWEPSGTQALEIAQRAEAAGVDAITVHPRTARQGFRGTADWSLIARVKQAVAIPVIGNGDVADARDAGRMLADTGCDGVMVGRAAIGNPFIFRQMLACLAGRLEGPPAIAERFDVMEHYVRESVRFLGEHQACRMMRSRLGWFVKGLPGSSAFRQSIKEVADEARLLEMLAAFRLAVDRRLEGLPPTAA
jgi:tRNA-dihydrouridine synthase B